MVDSSYSPKQQYLWWTIQKPLSMCLLHVTIEVQDSLYFSPSSTSHWGGAKAALNVIFPALMSQSCIHNHLTHSQSCQHRQLIPPTKGFTCMTEDSLGEVLCIR